jgi:hypothetical protein
MIPFYIYCNIIKIKLIKDTCITYRPTKKRNIINIDNKANAILITKVFQKETTRPFHKRPPNILQSRSKTDCLQSQNIPQEVSRSRAIGSRRSH